jgi:hypothetical protein
MTKLLAIVCLFALCTVNSLHAQEGKVPTGVPHLDHVFVIMMENHGFGQIFNNPNAPFINKLAKSANLATNYFAVGHPSLTNYLELVGGSNFGVRSDNYPNWHSAIPCSPNLLTGMVATDTPSTPVICPIQGTGLDAETPALDCTNEVPTPIVPPSMASCYWDIDGFKSVASAKTIGKTIADQLFERGKNWKSYQEDLPLTGADKVNISDGFFSNLTDFTPFITDGSFSSWTAQSKDTSVVPNIPASPVTPITDQTQAQGDIVYLYAVKHNPFVYFENVQQGTDRGNSLRNVVGFEGSNGLWADLASGDVPSFSFIAPNQCNDQHGRGNAGPFCNFDAVDDGSQSGLNETEILRGDVTVKRIVSAIEDSTAWKEGNSAIVLLWDENDYTATPNRVMTVVQTNYGDGGAQSSNFYTHFSLLKSLEGGFGLPCLNHACDPTTTVMGDLFANGKHGHRDDRDDDDDNR